MTYSEKLIPYIPAKDLEIVYASSLFVVHFNLNGVDHYYRVKDRFYSPDISLRGNKDFIIYNEISQHLYSNQFLRHKKILYDANLLTGSGKQELIDFFDV